ncbi:MAG: hypothetical protein D6719_06015, partial [Candidatus Dadabacteria bacterium]
PVGTVKRALDPWADAPSGGKYELHSWTKYDTYGNPLCTTTDHLTGRNYDPCLSPSHTLITYDAQGLRPVIVEDELGLKTVNTWDIYGRLEKVTKPSGVVSKKVFDELGRVKEERLNGTLLASHTYSADSRVTSDTTVLNAVTGDSATTETYMDGLGRVVFSKTTYSDPAISTTCYGSEYDRIGRTTYSTQTIRDKRGVKCDAKTFNPRSWQGIETVYDKFGRIDHTVAVDGTETDLVYSTSKIGFSGCIGCEVLTVETLTSNPGKKGQRIIDKSYDMLGSLRIIEEHPDSVHTYKSKIDHDYGVYIDSLTDALGNTSFTIKNWLGYTILDYSVDNGSWIYDYDDKGQVTWQIDAKENTQHIFYDAAGHLVCNSTSGAATAADCDCMNQALDPASSNQTDLNKFASLQDVCYFYDTQNAPSGATNFDAGSLVKVVSQSGVTETHYDEYGNVKTLDEWICVPLSTDPNDPQVKCSKSHQDYTYGAAGLLHSMTLDGSTVSYNYDGAGRTVGISLNGKEQIRSVRYTMDNGPSLVDSFEMPLDQTRSLTRKFYYYGNSNPEPGSGPSYRLKGISTYINEGKIMTPLYSSSYTAYDVAGNIISVGETDGQSGNTTTSTYSYDNLNRLIEAEINDPALGKNEWIQFVYNPIGNLTERTLTVSTANTGSPGGPHIKIRQNGTNKGGMR